MEAMKLFPAEDVKAILELYGFAADFGEQKEYIHEDREDGDEWVRIVLSVHLPSGKRVVLKVLHEGDDVPAARAKTEKQSIFAECMRQNGILTPKRYTANGKYCNEYTYNGLACNVTVEDWCGEPVQEINLEIAHKIGDLMARMHLLSLQNKYVLGCGTLFSAVGKNDVDAYEDFCEICEDEHLERSAVSKIKALREEKMQAIRRLWGSLPKAAVQGDISINNLVYQNAALTVFDYNNAGDEALVSDLVLEGLLTAYEMELPAGADPACREQLFPALLKGYLSRRRLNSEEADAAWNIYTLYHALWFSRVVFRGDSLQKLVRRQEYAAANRLLSQMLTDMTERDDGRFRE